MKRREFKPLRDEAFELELAPGLHVIPGDNVPPIFVIGRAVKLIVHTQYDPVMLRRKAILLTLDGA